MALSEVFEALKQSFSSDQIAIKGTEAYEKLNKSYLSLLQSALEPAAIVIPQSSEEVAKLVQLLKPYVLEGGLQLAVRGGGQQPVPGCSNISGDGITVDLRLLTGIEVKENTVAIRAGQRWGPVYEKLAEVGLGVSGSRSALGGIGGLALAGTIFLQSILRYNSECLAHTDMECRWTFLLLISGGFHLRHGGQLRDRPFERRHHQCERRGKLRSMARTPGRRQQLWDRHEFRAQDLRARTFLGWCCFLLAA